MVRHSQVAASLRGGHPQDPGRLPFSRPHGSVPLGHLFPLPATQLLLQGMVFSQDKATLGRCHFIPLLDWMDVGKKGKKKKKGKQTNKQTNKTNLPKPGLQELCLEWTQLLWPGSPHPLAARERPWPLFPPSRCLLVTHLWFPGTLLFLAPVLLRLCPDSLQMDN